MLGGKVRSGVQSERNQVSQEVGNLLYCSACENVAHWYESGLDGPQQIALLPVCGCRVGLPKASRSRYAAEVYAHAHPDPDRRR